MVFNSSYSSVEKRIHVDHLANDDSGINYKYDCKHDCRNCPFPGAKCRKAENGYSVNLK